MIAIEALSDILTKAAILGPVITGVVQAIKIAGFPSRFLPLVAILLGAIAGWLFVTASSVGILAGVILGLSSVGLFETLKTTVAGR